MSFIQHFYCTYCGEVYDKAQLLNLCPKDNRPIQVALDIPSIQSHYQNQSWLNHELKSMWRYGPLLALDINDPHDKQFVTSLGEGFTPLVPLDKFELATKHDFTLLLKDEGQPHPNYGANPTGSFKDRGMSMAVSMARKFGIEKVVVPTQGNAGDSLVEYALQANMECVVIMPDDTPMPIMGKVAALAHIHPHIQLELVEGTIREAGELMKQKYLPQGFFNMATFQEPGWRIEGKKTLGLELAEALALSEYEWKLPEVILYPTGGGTGILGMWKAFDELEALGLISSDRPRIISVQSNITPPVVNAFVSGDKDTTPVDGGNTIATGLNVPGGVGHFKVLEILKASQGAAIAVDEKAIGMQLNATYQNYGIWICPEGAACLAAIPHAIEQSLINAGETVVAFNTGSFEKYLPNVRKLVFADYS